MTGQSPAHDTKVEIGGDVYWVRRDFDLIRRIEQAFGPLAALDEKLRRRGVAVDDLVKLYAIVMKKQASPPPEAHVREHIAEGGIANAHDQLAVVVVQLFAGNARTVRWLMDEAKKAEGGGEAAPPENPMARALSTGIAILKRQATSDGRPESSGPRPFTI